MNNTKSNVLYTSWLFFRHGREKRANLLFSVAKPIKTSSKIRSALLPFAYKTLFPKYALESDVERGIVTCLDYLGRSAQAQKRLEGLVSLGKSVDSVNPNEMVAKIGDRAITLNDVNRWLNKLPPDVARQYSSPEGKLELLRMKISDQLLYDAALRAGYDKRPYIAEAIDDMKRQTIAQAYYQDRVPAGYTADERELSEFYERYKDDLFGSKPIKEIRDSVISVFSKKKMNEARMSLSKSLYDAERVEIFPKNLGIEERQR
jgi:hypothetical protein